MLRNITSRAAACRSSQRVCHRRVQQQQQQHLLPTSNSSTLRTYAAGNPEKKRALNAQQLKGSGAGAAKPPQAAEPPAAEGGESGGGGSGAGTLVALLVAAGGVGAAYSQGLLDEYIGDGLLGAKKETEKEKPITEAKATPTKATQPVAVAAVTKETDESSALAAMAKEELALSKQDAEAFNEIISDVLGEASVEVEGVKEAVAAIAAEEHKAAQAAAEAVQAAKKVAKQSKKAKKKSKKEKSKPVAEEEPPSDIPVVVGAAATAAMATSFDESKIMAEIEALRAQLTERSDAALNEAHTELAKLGTLDVLGKLDLDTLSKSQLKVRLVQMARDLEERTKWEAVRLQEFLTMKEKEVEDRYVLLIKKLRLEAEHLQEEKLAEQKKMLTAQAEEALKEQQTRSDAFIQNSMEIQEKAHSEDKASFEKTTKEAMDAKYEELLNQELTKIKEDFATKMNQRVRQMEELTKKLADLELSLQQSKTYKTDSVEAHRITAAAIALMEKLDSGDPAGAAVKALEAVASENVVVSEAVNSLPSSVSLTGVPTLQELQATFEEKVYPQCRKAANIPSGMDGLEGQLLGGVFSFLKFPPGPDEAAPEAEKDTSEYVLARIKRYVQLGELENAVKESQKLQGQVAFTAKDWETKVKDRVTVEKALKVIRMECALANENLTKVTAA